ncbi:unnamed protein product [Phytomonas sp. EM1]|nr:unnamed protein product [Phytomonas sp. EM1]|eukprot:CCW59833.1 unnamed protein product [Phytomonas sp. isolate EM1]
MGSIFREYRLHHSSPDGILVQLPGHGGFGRLTKQTLGDDKLAECLFKNFSAREHVSAILCRNKRDSQGYLQLTVLLTEVWSDLYTYPPMVRELLQRLLRKHLLVGLGTTTAGRVIKSNTKGTVLTIPPNFTAVAALERVDASRGEEGAPCTSDNKGLGPAAGGAQATGEQRDLQGGESKAIMGVSHAMREVRILNYDVEANVVNVTFKTQVVENTPLDTAMAALALASMPPGSTVTAGVLLSNTDDRCAVVEILATVSLQGHQQSCSILGYYLFNMVDSASPPPVVGAKLQLTVEFSAEVAALQAVLPFVVLSNRRQMDSFASLPAVRGNACLVPAMSSFSFALSERKGGGGSSTGLFGCFPWRQSEESKHPGDVESDDEFGGDAGNRDDGKSRIRRRRLEEAIDAYERGMDQATPSSPEEFQRLLLANPNSSYLWTQYMAYYVGLQKYEEARQIAEKALSTIGVREQDERLNVWVAYLNLENLYGTAESLALIFKRAIQRQLNPFVLHERLADIYAASNKPNQLLALCRNMTSKFRNERTAWERLGITLVDQNKRDQLKRVIKDISSTLKRNEAALAIVHIAIHEYKKGSVESGRALFETFLAKSPKKTDIWSTYLDQELGLLTRRAPESSVTHVRTLFERAVSMSFSAKVTHQILSRFLNFEIGYGTPENVEKVKERARAYVSAKIQAVTGTTNAVGGSTN